MKLLKTCPFGLFAGQLVFNFEIIFSLPQTCIYATKDDKKQTPQTLSPRDDNLFLP